MGLVPANATKAYLEQPGELLAAMSEARRSGLEPVWDPNELCLRMAIKGPPAPAPGEPPLVAGAAEPSMWTEPYLLEGVFDDYRTLPPIWRFLDPRDGRDVGTAAYPQPLGPSVFHTQGLICAHFNRMAYAENGGPHGNWNGTTAWQQPVEGTIAMHVAAMLARLIWEVRYNSAGRMAELPAREEAA
jgi:hypothetical protein